MQATTQEVDVSEQWTDLRGALEATADEALLSEHSERIRIGVVAISAGNYGGKLGKHHFHLREILAQY